MNVGFKLEKLLNNEYNQLPLLYFSSFLFGILAYFSLEYEPNLRKVLYLFVASLSLLYLRRFGVIGMFFSIVTIFFVAGILAGTIRTHFISPSTLSHSIKTQLSGRIDSIKPKITGTQIIISDVKFEKEIENPPHKIRVNVRTNINGSTIGDYIKLYACERNEKPSC